MQDGYVPGATVASRAATIAADFAAIDLVRSSNMKAVLFNLGANDSYALPAEATWKANLATILDAMNAQWPAAKVYVMRPWTRAHPAECNTMATWTNAVLVARAAWASVGPDERVYLENGDDGVTYTYDGVHPTAAGYVLTAAQWKTALGY